MSDILSDNKQVPTQSLAADNGGGKQAARVWDRQRYFGEVVGLMAFSNSHEYLFLGDLKWAVLPPLSLRQYRLVRDENKQAVAYVSWAWVNAEVEARLAAGQIKLRPNEWNCGEQAVIMDMLSRLNSEEAQNKILSGLKEDVFTGRNVKVMHWDAGENRLVLRGL